MFIHRSNVEQFVHGKPRPKATQLASSFVSHVPPSHEAAASSSTRPRSVVSSDSEEITVEEIFPVSPLHGVRSARDTSHSIYRDPSARTETVISGELYETANVLQRQAASSVFAPTSRCTPHIHSTAGVGGASPLVLVSPGESCLSNAYGLRRGIEENDTINKTDVDACEPAMDSDAYREAYIAGEGAAEEHVCRNLLVTSSVANTAIENGPVQQRSTFNRERELAGEVSEATQTITAVLVPDKRGTSSHRSSKASVQADQPCPPRLCSVSELGRTLTAATKALSAAAQREARRREEEEARAQPVLIPSLEAHLVFDALLGTALKEKVLLFDAYFTSLQSICEAMELCAALYRRDADRARRETDYVAKDQERATQHKMALYRQHMTAEALRTETVKKHEAEMQAAKAQAADLMRTVENLKIRLAQQEAVLSHQQQLHDAEMKERLSDMQEAELELRALQKAHGQATERWMALQVLYNAFQSRNQHTALQQQQRRRRRQQCADSQVPRLTLCDPAAWSNECFEAPRVTPKAIKTPLTREDQTGAQPLDHGSMRKMTVNPLKTEGESPTGYPAGLNGTSDAPTALEALLERTRSESSTLLTSPVQSQHGALKTKLRSPSTTSYERPTLHVMPPARGTLTSPPDSPVLFTATGTPLRGVSKVNDETPKKKMSDVLESPDAKPASAPPQQCVSPSSSCAGDNHAADVRRDSTSARQTSSSFRPSRLNSIASTRQGSSPALLGNVVTTSTHAVSVCNNEGKAVFSNENRAGVPFSMEVEEKDVAEWVDYMGQIAAAVVQRELFRLLTFTLPNQRKKPQQATANNFARDSARNGAEKLQTSTSGLVHGSFLSSPRLDESVFLASPPAQRADGDDADGASATVALSTLQWIRVCETAHLSARMNSVIVEKLQALSNSLSQRIQLLEEKDWNKTMAKQFIAVDHAAALRRLTAEVDMIVHGPLSSCAFGATIPR